jgi:hypothetical protein
MNNSESYKQTTPPKNGEIKVVDCVIEDFKNRSEMGKNKYNHYLETDNGRSALQDAYEEASDFCMYVKQLRLEFVKYKNILQSILNNKQDPICRDDLLKILSFLTINSK